MGSKKLDEALECCWEGKGEASRDMLPNPGRK
jgi:hypothetical protein